ncbi:MAG: ABC transporter ATP-binding protein [Myxococcales bacterium]|nr:ABC transporter ATP-binding protein [Myxococcales bacterium]
MIRVEGVGHRFGALRVLTDVWFHVPEGEVFGFIGPNGAGKTTTLRMMATLLEPDEGRVLLDGVDVVDDPAAVRRLLGFMPDSFGVYERVTVIEYLDFFAAAYDIERSARARTVRAVMELTDLGPLRDRLVAAMSKGMKQRLAIARTLLHDPKVLILDEPANGLDPRARIEMRDLILQLRDLGKTVLLSSHILTELSDMVSSVAILEKGRVLAAGKVDEIGKGLRPGRTLRMTLLRPPADVRAPFLDMSNVHEVSVSPDGALRLSFEGGDETVAELVARAVSYGVVRVEPERDDLERIFLEVTKGELQ